MLEIVKKKISYRTGSLEESGESIINKIILITIYILFLFIIDASLIEFEDKSIILKNDFYSIEAVQIKENKIKIYKEISKELGLQIKMDFDDEIEHLNISYNSFINKDEDKYNGEIVETSKYYYENGQLKKICSYVDSLIDGELKIITKKEPLGG